MIAKSRRRWLLVVTLVAPISVSSLRGQNVEPTSSVRFNNERIAEVFQYARRKSTAFDDLVITLEGQDRVVYIEEGGCAHSAACLQPLLTPGRSHLQIRLNPREAIDVVVARLAHELFHASEIARDPGATDAASIRRLYERIGYRSCLFDSDCWETRAAVAFETLVRHQLNGGTD